MDRKVYKGKSDVLNCAGDKTEKHINTKKLKNQPSNRINAKGPVPSKAQRKRIKRKREGKNPIENEYVSGRT